MTNRFLSLLAISALAIAPALACTGLIATKGATTDGSVMITYNADSHQLYGFLSHTPEADHAPGEMRRVVDWDSQRYLGEIPQVAHTYAVTGNINNKGLAVTESTWGGREELVDPNGLIDYGSLITIALERASNAREAIDVMTSLVQEYGYASEGESFSIADPNEAWILEMIGKGPDEKGAVWVARRIPDGYISGHANHSRIHQFPLNDPENTLYSPDVISFARKQGYFDGKDEDFSFSKAYAITDTGATRGCDARVYAFYNKYAKDDMSPYLPWLIEAKGEVLPLWVEPKQKLTAQNMRDMMRDHFEGTYFDMVQDDDPGSGPFETPYRWRPMSFTVDSVTYLNERAISTQQTGFSVVAQLNEAWPKQMQSMMWFTCDDPAIASYIPVFGSLKEVPWQINEENGDLLTISWDSMFWVNNYVANQAYNRWNQMYPDVLKVQTAVEQEGEEALQKAIVEVAGLNDADAADYLQNLTSTFAKDATTRYKTLGDYLLVKYMDGNVKVENQDGTFARTEEGVCVQPKWPGYNQMYYRTIANSKAADRLRSVE